MAANNSSTGDLLSSESGFRYCHVVRYILFSSLIFCFIFDVGCSDFKKYIVSINYRLLYFCGKYQIVLALLVGLVALVIALTKK